MKVLSPKVHAVLDYLVVLAMVSAPTVFGFDPKTALLTYAAAAGDFSVTAGTAFPGGIVKIIPFRIHGILEGLVSLVFLAMPWVFGFGAEIAARNFFCALGLFVGSLYFLTDYSRSN